MNRIIISGNVVKEPEIRVTQSGKSQVKLTVAVRRSYKNRQTGEYETDFFVCTDWGNSSNYIGKYIHKGSRVIVEGQMSNNSYIDKNGDKRYFSEIIISNIENLTWTDATKAKMARNAEQNEPYMTGFREISQDDLTEQDLPF